MNYGRYFRLNQSLSKVADGVAVYDYVDLPAYFGPSVDNPMSPKYPISVTVTSDAVCFRLHYCAFKIEEKDCAYKERKDNVKEENHKEEIRKFLEYAYDKDEVDNKLQLDEGKVGKIDAGIGMAHMEEMILELPWNDSVSNRLSDTIKKIYNTTFPQVVDENTSMGGRFLEQLIKKRYPGKENADSKELDIEKQLYRNLQKVSDETVSYSTLWLMDLVRGNRIYLYSIQTIKDAETKNNKEIDVITGFLRKLLLDFMFDLKHSDVFQNSENYQKMYSGLMSDFFFSALMHKCEYYYYRKLINDQIAIYESEKEVNKRDRIKEQIVTLYVAELANAEKSWVHDVMSLKSETEFDSQSQKGRILQRMGLFESDIFRPCPSWFAEPEEEMRRICFPMKEMSGAIHICNVDTLKEYLGLDNNDDKIIEREIEASRKEMREKVSRWFLKRYDFSGALYFHLSKPWNIKLLIGLLAFCLCLFILPYIIQNTIDCRALKNIQYYFPMIIVLVSLAAILVYFHYKYKRVQYINESLDLSFKKQSYNRIKVFIVLLLTIVISISDVFLGFVFISSIVLRKELNLMIPFTFVITMTIGSLVDASPTISTCFKLFVSIFYIYILVNKRKIIIKEVSFYLNKVISYLHLFLPRLVASITAAWITLTVGFDLYAAFFDRSISWPTGIFIGSVVLLFIMYEINKIASSCSVGRKILRSMELLLISYTISLLVGIVVIDFVGARYVDRGGIDAVFEKEYNYKFNENSENYGEFKDTIKVSGLPRAKEVENIEAIKTKIIKFKFGEHDVFYMRDFLFMFAFIAMFIGIFLQMIIFEEKQMTEL